MSLAKLNDYKIPVLLLINSFFFWFIIQTFRLIPIDFNFINLLAIILAIAVLIDFFIHKYLINTFTLKISFILFTVSLISLFTSNLNFFFILIFLSYGLFFPAFINEIIKEDPESNNKWAILIIISLVFSLIANLIERMFFLTFNPILVYIIAPLLCILLIFIVKEPGREVKDKNEAQKPNQYFQFDSKIKKSLFSLLNNALIGCIYAFQLIFFNNPSLIGVHLNFSYNLTVFIILISYAGFIAYILYFPIDLTVEDKKLHKFIILFNSVILITFSILFLFHSPFSFILFIISNLFLLILLVFLLSNIKTFNLNAYFFFFFGGGLILFYLCSLYGLPSLFILINCFIMFGCSLILLIYFKRDIRISFEFKNQVNFKKFYSIIIIVVLMITLIPLYKMLISQDQKSYDKKVLAFYYPWYGNPTDYTNDTYGIDDPTGSDWYHWNEGTTFEEKIPTPDDYSGTNTPVYGLYDSNDPNLIKKHLDLAKQAKIDALICSWWGIDHETDITFKNILTVAKNVRTSIKFTLYYETNQHRFINNPISDTIKTISDEVIYIFDEYYESPYFFMVNNKPVLFFYTTMIFSPLVWDKIIANIRNKYDCFLIADVLLAPEVKIEILSSFDGIHTYNPTFYINQQRQISSDKSSLGTIGDLYKSMIQVARSNDKLCALTTIPGYDDRVIRDPGILIKRDDGDTYDYLWKKCLDADWVLITSFNEWHEGTEIEPSEEYGNYYITRTKYWADKFI